VGESALFRRVLRLIDKTAPNDSTAVLISARAVPGKEMRGAFIWIKEQTECTVLLLSSNCSTISESLMEATLRTWKRAFTNAFRVKTDWSRLQMKERFFWWDSWNAGCSSTKVLRFPWFRWIPQGWRDKTLNADVRIIAATNRNLNIAIKNGRFREDLFYRLNVISMNCLPPREKEDIKPLAKHFLGKYEERFKKH